MVEIQSLTVFNELMRCGSIRQAADALNVSPTAIARQLDKLEHLFGTALVERNPRGIRLTAAGEVLAERSLSIARDLNEVEQIIDDLRGLQRGAVSLYVNGAASSAILAPALAEFSQRYPAITIEVTVTSAQAALDAVANGLTDLSVTMFSTADSRIETRFRAPIRHEAILSPDHPLAQCDEIALVDLVEHPLALPDRTFGVRRAFDARLRDAGLQCGESTFTTSSLELQKELARRGTAVLILPEMTVKREIDQGSLVMRPLASASRIETHLEMNRVVAGQRSFAARRLSDFLEGFLRTQFS
ncbi:LysR family transcriptional regulator [Thalassospira lucentensis]|uniref:LysR family transcriptional regulator n=1 Tax=Thalassospira lucentensis TaxID=168935 RepID=UPI00142D29E9|nr:LysR family transcriptional regulator [Thalassospira lucentensis]NIZ03567.1 LysR family transcriptional regulator [Thalassospira lucentensis]